MKLENKVSIVTGGSCGIGKEISRLFLSEGSDVAILDINKDEGLKTINEFKEEYPGRNILFTDTDISDNDSVERSINDIFERFGRIDILVNNAGITKDNLLLRMSLEEFRKVIDINLTGTFICCKAVSRYMVRQKYGRIINISSVIGIRGNAGQCNYAASKAGVIGLTKSLAKELASRNINVNAIAPGFIKTDMTEKLDDKYKEKIIEMIPSGKLGNAKDVASAALYLACEDSDYVTGSVIKIDGGMAI
ncbi:MAG TPA: 3-oxoacyl-[acyl-carrier-protein] reductase [Actinobacteria bacterium]|nr:3-oxoacyl-[acyl-carrier-protein] reductase [Actinomycetota bacterium]